MNKQEVTNGVMIYAPHIFIAAALTAVVLSNLAPLISTFTLNFVPVTIVLAGVFFALMAVTEHLSRFLATTGLSKSSTDVIVKTMRIGYPILAAVFLLLSFF